MLEGPIAVITSALLSKLILIQSSICNIKVKVKGLAMGSDIFLCHRCGFYSVKLRCYSQHLPGTEGLWALSYANVNLLPQEMNTTEELLLTAFLLCICLDRQTAFVAPHSPSFLIHHTNLLCFIIIWGEVWKQSPSLAFFVLLLFPLSTSRALIWDYRA